MNIIHLPNSRSSDGTVGVDTQKFSVRQLSCGKVMFSVVSFCLSFILSVDKGVSEVTKFERAYVWSYGDPLPIPPHLELVHSGKWADGLRLKDLLVTAVSVDCRKKMSRSVSFFSAPSPPS